MTTKRTCETSLAVTRASSSATLPLLAVLRLALELDLSARLSCHAVESRSASGSAPSSSTADSTFYAELGQSQLQVQNTARAHSVGHCRLLSVDWLSLGHSSSDGASSGAALVHDVERVLRWFLHVEATGTGEMSRPAA
eukprot:CAMPEP_0195590514 /NCGR_PEP_ID=MMETSP0814-20130614/34181_1 /TAXON_ID=97485 /ORGANISM="Prymnesium parvum, Strain Texoma1" /LENGTH=138 /DNA_ID=CAMNT_0040729553 /DNA_START=619 /DNA_END=1032 /DNA_ORIENTATION=+